MQQSTAGPAGVLGSADVQAGASRQPPQQAGKVRQLVEELGAEPSTAEVASSSSRPELSQASTVGEGGNLAVASNAVQPSIMERLRDTRLAGSQNRAEEDHEDDQAGTVRRAPPYIEEL